MARQVAFWTQLRNTFDPDEILAGQRSKDLYCEREHSPFEDMRLDFDKDLRPVRPPMVFFTGHRGSGKSSLLLRLVEHLKDDYFVVYFDIEQNLDSSKANQVDLLYLIGATVFRVAEQEGARPDEDYLRNLAESVYVVTKTRQEARNEALNAVELLKGLIGFGASMLGARFGEKLAEAALKPFTLTSGVSEQVAISRTIEPQVQDIINNANLIISDVQTRTDRPVLIVVDGLDKLQRPEQTQLIFVESRALRGLRCPVIYTVPMLIHNFPQFGQVEEEGKSYLLSNVKLYEKAGDQRYEPGYNTMRDVVVKRLRPLGLQPDEVFEPGVLDLLIFKSGGLMRWFISLLQEVYKAAESKGLDKVDVTAAQKAIDDRVVDLSSRLTTVRREELRKVRQGKLPSGNKESNELLHGLFIVAYRNGSTWFDAHPLLWDQL